MLYSLGAHTEGADLMVKGVSGKFLEGLVDIIMKYGDVTSGYGRMLSDDTMQVEAPLHGYLFRTESLLVSSKDDYVVKASYIEISQEEAHARFGTAQARGCLRTFCLPCESRGVLVLRFTWGIRLVDMSDAIYQHGVYTVGYPAYDSVTLAGSTYTASPYFYAQGRTRLSLVTPRDQAATDYKRQSFLLTPGEGRNQTFLKYFDGTRVTCFGRPGEKARGARSLLARFSVEALTKAFYTELFAWYDWAAKDEAGVRFPDAVGDLAKTKEHLIRLITRLMFVWFVRERGLVPDELFDAKWLGERFLRDFDPDDEEEGTYYNAILQNLFFATLNQPVEERRFADERSYHGKNASYGVNTLFRDKGTRGGAEYLVQAVA